MTFWCGSRRLRCYRYVSGQAFLPHYDGSQQAAALTDEGRELRELAGRRSRYSCLIYLNSLGIDFEGGATALLPSGEAGAAVRVAPEAGSALVFPHGDHPKSLLHAGEAVTSGTKYVIRTDIF